MACLVAGLLVVERVGAWQIPLTEAEHSQVVSLALSLAESDRQVPGDDTLKRTALGETLSHPLGLQVLLTELQEVKNTSTNDARRVEVFLFDYDNSQTLRQVIDVEQMVEVSTTRIDSPHLPLTQGEIQYVRSLLMKHKELDARIKAELANIEESLHQATLADLHARISIRVPNEWSQSEANCDRQRCALVSLFTASDFSLSVEPVVNLHSGEIFLDTIY